MIFSFRKFLIKTRLIALLFMFILALGGIAWNSSSSQSNVSAQFAEQDELVVVGLNDASLALEGALMVSKYPDEAGFYGQLKKDDIRTQIQTRRIGHTLTAHLNYSRNGVQASKLFLI